MQYRRVIMALVCQIAICCTCAPTSEETKVVEFEGGLVLEVTIQEHESVKVINGSERMPTSVPGGMVVSARPDYEALFVVDIRPSAWTDEILLNYMRQEAERSFAPQDNEGATITEKASKLASFSSDSSSGFFQTLKLANAHSNRELSAVFGGHIIDDLWIQLMLTVPASDSPPIEEFIAFTESVSVARSVNDDFLQADDFVPRRLKVLQVQ